MSKKLASRQYERRNHYQTNQRPRLSGELSIATWLDPLMATSTVRSAGNKFRLRSSNILRATKGWVFPHSFPRRRQQQPYKRKLVTSSQPALVMVFVVTSVSNKPLFHFRASTAAIIAAGKMIFHRSVSWSRTRDSSIGLINSYILFSRPRIWLWVGEIREKSRSQSILDRQQERGNGARIF